MNWIATRFFGKPTNKSLTWWLVEKQYNLKAQIVGLIAYFATFSVLFLSWQSSLAFIISMYGHELGHYIQFRANKIKAVILLLWPIGAGALAVDEAWNKKSDELPWNNVAWLLLAGPAFNMFQMMIGLVFVKFDIFPEFFRNYVFINGMLGLFNLLPIGNFDGGQLYFVIFSSLIEWRDKVLAAVLSLAGFAVLTWVVSRHIEFGLLGVAYSIYQQVGVFVFVCAFIFGILHKQGRDNPEHANSRQAMTTEQAAILVVAYVMLVTIMLALLKL